MKADILAAKRIGVHGVVFGILNSEGTIDTARVRELVQLAQPMQVTFHRAFDMVKDPFVALEEIILIGGIQRILTSYLFPNARGTKPSVMQGIDTIKALIDQAKGRIIIMPGGGIREAHVPQLVDLGVFEELHVAAFTQVPSKMTFKNESVYMGLDHQMEYVVKVSDGAAIARIKASMA